MNKVLSSWIVIGVIVIAGLGTVQPTCASSETDICGEQGAGEAVAEEYITKLDNGYVLEQPFGGLSRVDNLGTYVQTLYQFAIGFVLVVSVILLMAGGLLWISAAGNEARITSAKEIILSAVASSFIAGLSFPILTFINPAATALDVAVFKIPINTQCPYETITAAIPEVPGLEPHGGKACPNAISALVDAVALMRVECPTCTINVGSAYRSPEQQEPLYACYQKCVDEGYIDSSGTKRFKDGQPAGCSSCNKAAKPCCSNHQKGIALDVWLDIGEERTGVARTGENKLNQSYNNGGGDTTLAANQALLRTYMEKNKKFKNFSAEWWHFDLTSGQCGAGSTTTGCTAGTTLEDGTQTAAEGYCVGYQPDGKPIYSYATCTANKPTCNAPTFDWYYLAGGSCVSDSDALRYVEFDEDDSAGAFTDKEGDTFLKEPSCTKVLNSISTD